MKASSYVIQRADRALFLALAIILATVTASFSAASSPSPQASDSHDPIVRLSLSPYDLSPSPAVPAAIPQESSAGAALKQLLSEYTCLAEVMYYEARGEGQDGEKAVAEVVLHRLKSGDHGTTICAVVYQGAAGTYCQFTFACDGSLEKAKEAESWRQAQVLAAQILVREAALNEATDGATYYHATSVSPRWADKLTRVVQIGAHIFYKQPPEAPSASVKLRGSL